MDMQNIVNIRPRALDHGDPRTPMAWQHRNMNYQQQHHVYPERFAVVHPVDQASEQYPYYTQSGADPYTQEVIRGPSKNQQYQTQLRTNIQPGSPCTESTSSSSSSEGPDMDPHNKYDGTLALPDIHSSAVQQHSMGTLHSVHSTLSTWDGEPCPVHHVAVPIFMPTPPPPPPPPPRYPVITLPPPPVLLPPMMRPRPLVLPADNPAPPEPLPVRDPKTCLSPIPPKKKVKKKGHLVVLQIVLGIIMVGVILGVILRFVIA